MFLAQYFVEDIFFLPCYMTCYDFCKFVKAIDRSRNFAISKNRSLCDNGLGLSVAHCRHK